MLLQVDFSENYKFDIQSAHWAQYQITFFLLAVHISGTSHPIIITSDDLTRYKDIVILYMDKILDEIPKKIEIIHI